jgi:hypothetical protein
MMTVFRMIAIEKVARVTPRNSATNKHAPFHPDTPMPRKALRKLQREAKQYDIKFYRALRRATAEQFLTIEYSMRETELARLRLRRQTAEVAKQIANHEYDLKSIDELRYWRSKPRRQIKRRRFSPTPTVPATVARAMPIPEEFKEPQPDLLQVGKKVEPKPVEPDRFYSKFFHTPHDNSVW